MHCIFGQQRWRTYKWNKEQGYDAMVGERGFLLLGTQK